MWHKFLTNWNGVSMFHDSHFTAACSMELYTDSSLIGFGGIFQNQWFCSEWLELPSIKESDLSMAFRELYPIVAAALIWGNTGLGSEYCSCLTTSRQPLLSNVVVRNVFRS